MLEKAVRFQEGKKDKADSPETVRSMLFSLIS